MDDLLEPATWLVDHASLIPRNGEALDLASGRGRHALWLASCGLSVTAIDRSNAALDTLRRSADERGVAIHLRGEDIEAPGWSPGVDVFDVIVVVHYLHRPLFPALVSALRPGGLLVYETFTRAQAALGKPTNPDFLLEPGELMSLIRPLVAIDAREGFFDGRFVASVVARRPA